MKSNKELLKEKEMFFHVGGSLEHEFGEFWELDRDKPNEFGEVIFLGKFIDSKGQKWDIGFQDCKHIKTGVLVYSNEAPCYMSPSFKDIADAREQILNFPNNFCTEPWEEMINRAEEKSLIK